MRTQQYRKNGGEPRERGAKARAARAIKKMYKKHLAKYPDQKAQGLKAFARGAAARLVSAAKIWLS